MKCVESWLFWFAVVLICGQVVLIVALNIALIHIIEFVKQIYRVPEWDDMPIWIRFKFFKRTGKIR